MRGKIISLRLDLMVEGNNMEKPTKYMAQDLDGFSAAVVYDAKNMDKYIEHIKTEAGNAKLDEIIKMLKKQEARSMLLRYSR